MPASQGQAGLDADVDGVARISTLQRVVEGHHMRVGRIGQYGPEVFIRRIVRPQRLGARGDPLASSATIVRVFDENASAHPSAENWARQIIPLVGGQNLNLATARDGVDG
jgi:hypothetical protein